MICEFCVLITYFMNAMKGLSSQKCIILNKSGLTGMDVFFQGLSISYINLVHHELGKEKKDSANVFVINTKMSQCNVSDVNNSNNIYC